MTWNYRIVRHITPIPEKLRVIEGKRNETWYAIHEVYYDKGKVVSYTEEPIAPFGLSVEELKSDLRHMMEHLQDGVLNYEDLVGDDPIVDDTSPPSA